MNNISKSRNYKLLLAIATILVFIGNYGILTSSADYQRYANRDIYRPMIELCEANPSIASYESIGKSLTGKETLLFKIGNPNGGKLMVVGAIHGSEKAGSVTLYWFMDWLLNSDTPVSRRILQRNLVLLLPVANPDGFDANKRQNLNYEYCQWGVDLNRNFETGWRENQPNDYDYHGPYSLSEVETRNIVDALINWRPDQLLDIHEGGGPWLAYHSSIDSSEVNSVIEKYTMYATEDGVYQYKINQIYGPGTLINDAQNYGASSWFLEIDNYPDGSSDGSSRTLSDYQMKLMYFTKALPLFRALAEACELEYTNEVIIDDKEATFEGRWPLTSATSGYYGTSYRYRTAGSGSNTATWGFAVPKAGSYEVYAWWTSGSNRATDAPYTINHADGSTIVRVNQEENGGSWQSLGVYTFTETSSVTLSDKANEVVIADAIKLTYASPYTPPEIIADDPQVSFIGNWYGPTTSTSGYYGTGYRYRTAGSGYNTATWSFSVPQAGVWEVYAMWTNGSNRASNAPYTVNHAGGKTLMTVNQRISGGTWNSLGRYTFNAGYTGIVLSDNADGVVIADAIKIVYVG